MNARVISLVNTPNTKLTKPEFRFYKFVKNANMPITNDDIKNYYKENVLLYTGRWIDIYKDGKWTFDWKDYSDDEILKMSLMWFDRWLGKFIRKSIIKSDFGLVLFHP